MPLQGEHDNTQLQQVPLVGPFYLLHLPAASGTSLLSTAAMILMKGMRVMTVWQLDGVTPMIVFTSRLLVSLFTVVM